MGRYYTALDPERFQVPDDRGLVAWVQARLSQSHADELWLVAEVDGHVAGELEARVERAREGASRQILRELGVTRLLIDALLVDEPYRRQGIGTALMRAAEDWAIARGATTTFLNTYINSPTAVPFYERQMGFQRKSLGFIKALAPRSPA
jgi:GNAT superfamily N-acetyltransferase